MQWSQNLCRLCGQISEICHHIHDNHNCIDVKLKRYLNIKVQKSDYKPKQICDQCFNKLNELSAYIDMCYNTNTKYESIYRSSQAEASKTNHINVKLDLRLNSKRDNENGENIGRCVKTVVNKINTKTVPPVTLINPPNCKIKTTNSSIKIEQVRNEDNIPEPLSKVTGTQYVKAEKRMRTVKKIRNGTLQCPMCSKRCRLTDFCPFKCDICQKRFKTGCTLKQHLNSHLRMKFKCCLCTKEYKYKHRLVAHLNKHHKSCPYCKTKFESCKLLIKHLKVCEDKK